MIYSKVNWSNLEIRVKFLDGLQPEKYSQPYLRRLELPGIVSSLVSRIFISKGGGVNPEKNFGERGGGLKKAIYISTKGMYIFSLAFYVVIWAK